MHPSRFCLFALLPLFAGCQLLAPAAPERSAVQPRMQGEISQVNGQLLLRPCQEQRRFILSDAATSGILRSSQQLMADGHTQLFADLRGELSASSDKTADGNLAVSQLYRLQGEGHGCDDSNFKQTLVHASGNEPGWSLRVSDQGMVLNRPGQEPLALPYMEEQLPEGRLHLSSEANGQRLALWLTPGQCQDSMSGSLQHLSAELRLDDQLMRGCAYFGGARQ